VETNLEGAAARGNEFHRVDAIHLSNFGRQTGGSRLVVSHLAVLDANGCFHLLCLMQSRIPRLPAMAMHRSG